MHDLEGGGRGRKGEGGRKGKARLGMSRTAQESEGMIREGRKGEEGRREE